MCFYIIYSEINIFNNICLSFSLELVETCSSSYLQLISVQPPVHSGYWQYPY